MICSTTSAKQGFSYIAMSEHQQLRIGTDVVGFRLDKEIRQSNAHLSRKELDAFSSFLLLSSDLQGWLTMQGPAAGSESLNFSVG
jgi:hypothetical protein